MPKKGDWYEVPLEHSPVDWGDGARRTQTRTPRKEEGYVPIPKRYARKFQIVNINGVISRTDTLGLNLFNCSSADGLLDGVVKAAGCSQKGDPYAKQFQGNGNLRLIGRWLIQRKAKVGDIVRVEWDSPTKIMFTHIPK